MNYAKIRGLLLKIFIGFLSLTALVAIVSVLSGEFGKTQIKVLITTCSISAASICAMSCAAFLERKKAKAVGGTGILIASVSALLVIAGTWGEIPEEDYWRATATLVVLSVCFAHGCLLCLPSLAARYRWTQIASTILITLLAVQIIVAIWGKIDNEGFYRFLAALSVLVVLITLVIPICSRLGASAGEPATADSPAATPTDQVPEKLVLRKISAGVFADESGRTFQVAEIKTGHDIPPASA